MTARWRTLLWPGLATLIALAILIALGAWQWQRLAWKEGLVAQIEARAYGEPAPLPAAGDWSPEAHEYRRVRVTGTFLHDREALVHGLMAATRGQPVQGYYVLTPLRLESGATLMVNRGFVPTDLRAPETRAAGQVAGRVTVTGLLRASETRSLFVPENDPAAGRWFTRDIAAIARAQDLQNVLPYYLDADATAAPGGWPRGGQTRLVLANNHLQYALTWWGLGLTLIAVFVAFARRRLRMV